MTVAEILAMKKRKKKSQKAIEQELGCEFIRTDFDKEDFDIF